MKSLMLFAVFTASALFAQPSAEKKSLLSKEAPLCLPSLQPCAFPLPVLSRFPLSYRAQEIQGDSVLPDKAPKKIKAPKAPKEPAQPKAKEPAKEKAPTKEKTLASEKSAAPPLPAPSVIPAVTFQPFKISPSTSSTNFEFRTSLEPSQAPFKVSLIGVNVNSWLENPDSYQALADAAEKFPIESIFANLARYNPVLTFNNPALVKELLSLDIYTPYLKNLEKQPKMPPSFAERKGAVSFTRNYHIYGAAAGGLPYFGVPAEGSDRRIILASVKDQLLEYSARLPDTDIFLAATINITPNWLEEGWDVRQVNRQNAEIIIYAFNRKGRLIGGAGIPKTYLSKGDFITFSQKIESKIWQPSVSRAFYVWPSFKIINTPVPGSQKQSPAGALPPSVRPYLNRTQKYIARTIENVRTLGLPSETPIFDTAGGRIYNFQKTPPAPKIFLAKRALHLTNPPIEAKPTLDYPERLLAELEGTAPREALKATAADAAAFKEKKQKQERPAQSKKESKKAAENPSDSQAKEKAQLEKEALAKEKAEAKEKARLEKEALAKEKAEAKEKARLEKEAQNNSAISLIQSIQPAQSAALLFRAQSMAAKQNKAGSTIDDIQEQIDEKRSQKAAKERISVSEGYRMRKYFPSNEKDKIHSLVGSLPEALEKAPFYITNDIQAISNSIPLYETESDPVSYFSERRKYYSVLASARLYVRQFKKDTALFKKALKARMDDELFWAALYRKAILDNGLWTPEMEEAYTNVHEQILIRQKMELTRFQFNRDSELIKELVSNVTIFGKRELDYQKSKAKTPEKLAQKTVQNQENMAKALARYTTKFLQETYLQEKAQFEAEYITAAKDFDESYARYKALLPSRVNVSFLNSTSAHPDQLVSQNKAQWAGLAEKNHVPIELIAYVESNNFLYPTKRFRIAMQRKAIRAYKKNMGFIVFEGFALGLSGSWKAKTFTADRLTEL